MEARSVRVRRYAVGHRYAIFPTSFIKPYFMRKVYEMILSGADRKTPCGSADTPSYCRPHMGQGRRAESPQSGACHPRPKITTELAPKQEKQDFGEDVRQDNTINQSVKIADTQPTREEQNSKSTMVAEPRPEYRVLTMPPSKSLRV